MTRWEYHIVRVRLVEVALLNDLGQDGWELVSDVADQNSAALLIFKRPVQE